jgi:hypothetical protein
MLAIYYGHFRAEPGDNGWQLTGARLMAEDWETPLGPRLPVRWDRAGAAREYAAEDPVHALNLVRLHSGEWVPLTRLVPQSDLRLACALLRPETRSSHGIFAGPCPSSRSTRGPEAGPADTIAVAWG